MTAMAFCRRIVTSITCCLCVAVSCTKGAVPTTDTPPQCPPLPNISNGHINTYHNGYVLYYFCDWGYVLWGAESLHCGTDGRWSDQLPVCVASFGCTILPMLDHGHTYFVLKGGVATFECDVGYILSGSPAIYCDGRQWNSTMPICQPKKELLKVLPVSNCPHPPVVKDATREITDEAVIYRCQNGSSPTLGSEKLECGLHGQWRSPAVVCARIGCVIPEAPVNGFIIRKFSNAVLEFRCYEKFVLQGPSITFCDGVNWNGTAAPSCIPTETAIFTPPVIREVVIGGTRCLNAPIVAKAIVEYQRLKDSRGVLYWSANYVCQSGYRLEEQANVYCSDGKWTGKLPVCIFNYDAHKSTKAAQKDSSIMKLMRSPDSNKIST